MFCFKVCFLSKHFWPSFLCKRNCHLFSSVRFSSSNRGWYFGVIICFFIAFFRHGTGSLLRYRFHHTFILYTNIPWDRTSKRYGRVSCYMLVKCTEELGVFLIPRRVLYTQILFDKTLIMLERTMFLPCLLLVR